MFTSTPGGIGVYDEKPQSRWTFSEHIIDHRASHLRSQVTYLIGWGLKWLLIMNWELKSTKSMSYLKLILRCSHRETRRMPRGTLVRGISNSTEFWTQHFRNLTQDRDRCNRQVKQASSCRIWRVLTMVHNTQNYCIYGPCPLSGILNTIKQKVSETGSVFVLTWGEGDTYSVGPLMSGDWG
jgi:hypothetical protein